VLSVGGGFSCQLNGSLLSAPHTSTLSSVDPRLQSLAPVVYGQKMPTQPPLYPAEALNEPQQWTYNGISAAKFNYFRFNDSDSYNF